MKSIRRRDGIRIINETRGERIADDARLADRFFPRLVGLAGRSRLGPGEALILHPAQGIHTFFMRFPLDVIYLDAHRRVLATFSHLPPGRIGPFLRNARWIVELPAGALDRNSPHPGDQLCFEDRAAAAARADSRT